MDENYIKRERQRKEETKRTVAKMRAALKVCNMDDIRRYRLSFVKSLLIGLEEKGYYITAKLIQQLIDFQTELTEKAGPSSVLWNRPQLKDNNNLLKTISDNLVKVENLRKMEDHEKECETFLNISKKIAFLHPHWWWLGEQLLLQSISLGKDYPSMEGKYEALSRYVYAKYLLENVKLADAAIDNLTIVRELSKGKKWVTRSLFPDEKDYLYMRANQLLHASLMHEARKYMKTDFNKAIKLASIARTRAAEACDLDGETKALLLKGICELSIKNASAAIVSFSKAYYIQEKLGNLEGICTTQLHLSKAFMIHGDALQSLKTLLASRECAEQNNLSYYLAKAYKHLGEYYLFNGEPSKAIPLLGAAFKMFQKLGSVADVEQVRNLESISTGLELIPMYLKVLSDTNHPVTGYESLMKLIDWKNSRKQFWSDDDECCDPSPQVSNYESSNSEESCSTTLLGINASSPQVSDYESLNSEKSYSTTLLGINAPSPQVSDYESSNSEELCSTTLLDINAPSPQVSDYESSNSEKSCSTTLLDTNDWDKEIVELHDNIDAFRSDSNDEDQQLAFTEEPLIIEVLVENGEKTETVSEGSLININIDKDEEIYAGL